MHSQVEQSVDRLLQDYFSRLLAGQDVGPAQRYRTEGYLQACLACADLSEDQLRALMQPHIARLAQHLSQISQTLIHSEDAPSWALPYQVPVAAVNQAE